MGTMQDWQTKDPRHLSEASWIIFMSLRRNSWTRTGTIARWKRGSMPAVLVKKSLLSSEMQFNNSLIKSWISDRESDLTRFLRRLRDKVGSDEFLQMSRFASVTLPRFNMLLNISSPVLKWFLLTLFWSSYAVTCSALIIRSWNCGFYRSWLAPVSSWLWVS